jgi:endoglycosylceramidase
VVETQLVRPYAQATAGEPLAQRYDPATGDFTFRFRPDRTISSPTSIAVPGRAYPDGYDAEITGGATTSPADAGRLTVEPDASSTEVVVHMTRRS